MKLKKYREAVIGNEVLRSQTPSAMLIKFVYKVNHTNHTKKENLRHKILQNLKNRDKIY